MLPVALGSVVGNRLADAHKATIKPHLRERLAQASRHATTLGCVATGSDGRLSFVPNYLIRDREAVQGRSPAMPRPAFQPGEAQTPASHEEAVIGHSECALPGLVLVALDGVLWAFTPAFLTRACPGEDDDVRAAMTAAGCPF